MNAANHAAAVNRKVAAAFFKMAPTPIFDGILTPTI
jgi:hypothetical protein